MRSALFVDFDNCYTRLAEQDKGLAMTFATQPLQWISWLEQSLPAYGAQVENDVRRILVRRCYLNPKSYGEFRPYFIRSAFETIDCPTLTSFGKTSADVHMVLDMLDLQQHQIRYDEFIIMSADADFAPVLLKLRKWDIRGAVLAIGPAAMAYRAAADQIIDQDQFCEEALACESAGATTLSGSFRRDPIAGSVFEECSELVRKQVSGANKPVTLAVIAAAVRRLHPEVTSDWAGSGTFKQFLSRLDLPGLSISSVIPGYLYDPTKHAAPSGTESVEHEQTFREKHPEVESVARKIHELTDTPYLLPEHVSALLDGIAQEVNENGFNLTRVSKAVRDRCQKKGVPIGRQHVNFVLRGNSFTGHRFGEGREARGLLGKALFKSTISLCESVQLNLTEHEKRAVSSWLNSDA